MLVVLIASLYVIASRHYANTWSHTRYLSCNPC